MKGHPVSSPTYKELGDCHSCPHYKRKAEQTKNGQLSLDSSEKLRSQGRLLPQNCRDREGNNC